MVKRREVEVLHAQEGAGLPSCQVWVHCLVWNLVECSSEFSWMRANATIVGNTLLEARSREAHDTPPDRCL